MNEELVLEDKIIGSAKRVFLEKGFEKAKMQEIADTAGRADGKFPLKACLNQGGVATCVPSRWP